jgi:hypothetical protein
MAWLPRLLAFVERGIVDGTDFLVRPPRKGRETSFTKLTFRLAPLAGDFPTAPGLREPCEGKFLDLAGGIAARLSAFLQPPCQPAQGFLEGVKVFLARVVPGTRDLDLIPSEGDPMPLYDKPTRRRCGFSGFSFPLG